MSQLTLAPRRLAPRLALGLSLSLLLVASCHDGASTPGPDDDRVPGQTDFTTIEQGSGAGFGRGGVLDGAGAPTAGGTGGGGTTGSVPTVPKEGAPAGRVGDVKEADIYKLDGTRLFYLNTYRGFIVYDVTDPKQPAKVSRLPVYGYPIEMFVEGTTVYALLRDALYLTQADGKLQFQRHNVSQLVTIDVSDVRNPRVLKTLDIIGQLHEGVSRKIDNTIYVVSEQWGGYYWGWNTPDQVTKEQAWVYSYDVSDALNPRQAGQLQIFEGGNSNVSDPRGAITSSRWFGGVAISATSNALMVVENWTSYTSTPDPCGYTNSQEAVVSLIDISDPTGTIRRHTRFSTIGSLDDQFKMTYRADETAHTGTFFGIFARQTWQSCGLGVQTQNTLESWDVTDGANPRRLAALAFGKPGESVRASNYDMSRNVVYAITARQIDPLYAISIADAANPRVLSAIDGLSGSVSVFRNVGGGQFLLGVGQDQSDACTGTQDSDPSWRSTRMAVSIIDVRNLDAIRLVQRKCVSIQNAEWTWSNITWNQDQAHKMLGMFQDGDLNVITVPVSYYTQQEANVGWWYQWKTAVGLMTWDLTRYDPAKAPEAQTVVQTYGTFVHPQGEVTRSILFRHPVSGQRTMINLSDTHLSIANIQDLAAPRLEATVEVAPSVDEVQGFGDYIVERVDNGGYWSSTGLSEFRVKRAGGNIDEKVPVATFQVGQATATYRYKQSLVVLRYELDPAGVNPANTEAVVFDLSDPTHPRQAARVAVPFDSYRYYGFYCGGDFWGGYWFGQGQNTIVTDAGLVQLRVGYEYTNATPTYLPHLALLDLRDLNAPKVTEANLPAETLWGSYSLVPDPSAPTGFYVSHRQMVEQISMGTNGDVFTRFRYYAQRWDATPTGLRGGAEINLPGPLAQTWVQESGSRMFLTQDWSYRTIAFPDYTQWHSDTRLHLLRQAGSAAVLLDTRTFTDLSLSSFVIDSGRMYVSAQNQYYWYGYPTEMAANPPTWESTSDRLMIFDMSGGKLTSVYDQPTRTYGVQLMGMHKGSLFVSLPGDGVLVTDVSDPTRPQGTKFLRTLGWASHIEFAGNDAYVASGNFGVFNLTLGTPSLLPVDGS